MNKEELQKAVKPITDGLFGKYGTKRYERPHFPLRPLDRMLKDLAAIDGAKWYQYVFSREPLNGRFNDEQRKRWMEKALACGQEYAGRIMKEYGSSDPEILAKAMGMKVSYPVYPEKTDRVLFAEYRVPDTICIYMDAVKKGKKYLEQPQIREILTDKLDIGRLLLAHELFHCVEELYKDEIFTKTEKVRLWSIGPIHNDSAIIALSEIAAMAFAREITGIPYAPYVMDAFLVYGYSPEEASGLYEEMMEYAGYLPCDGEMGNDTGVAENTEQDKKEQEEENERTYTI